MICRVAERDAEGHGVLLRGCVIDETARHLAEEERRRSEEKFALAFESSPVAMAIRRSTDNTMLDANPAFLTMMGFQRDEVIGRTPVELGLIEDARAREVYAHTIESRPQEIELRVRTRRGSFVDLLLFARSIELDGELCFLTTLLDITERKRAENDIAASAERYRALFEHMTAGFVLFEVITDGAGAPTDLIVSAANTQFAETTGLRLPEAIGRRMSALLPGIEQDDADWIGTYGRIALGGAARQFEHGSDLLQRSYAVSAYQPEPGYCAVTFTDISERRHAEAERAALQQQLAQAQKMESIGQLAGGIAHDFNNMLGVILGHTDLAMRSLDPASEIYTDLQEVLKAAKRSADLTTQLLTFARKQNVSPRVVDINVAIDSVLKMLRRLIGENVRLTFLPGPQLWPVHVDPTQLDQILANLCVNARDAISAEGTVTIATSNVSLTARDLPEGGVAAPGDFVMLSVSDTGSGMDDATRLRIFEPFFTTKEIGRGTGLGLATVYGIVTQNGGHLEVSSAEGVGSTFRIYLPRRRWKDESRHQPLRITTATRVQATILAVEDEPSVLHVTHASLEAMGHRVFPAASAAEALRIAAEFDGRIDLLVTDVVMPEMNGRDLSQRLRATRPEMKHLFVSGYPADLISRRGALEEGVILLPKPFSYEELEAKVLEALSRG